MNFLEGLTFDDVLLIPQRSDVLPHQVDLTTKFSRNIILKIPLISAAMDTVTEAEMAIELAKHGGIGVIHRNMAPERQAEEVKKVKRAVSWFIKHPFTLHPDDTVEDARKLMSEKKISGILIIDKNGKLVGLVTKRDLLFEEVGRKKLREVMVPRDKLIVAKAGIEFKDAYRIFAKHKIEKLPVVDENNNLVGLITIKDLLREKEFPDETVDNMGRLRVAGAIGVGKDWEKRVGLLVEAEVDAIVIDTAHAHSKKVLEVIEEIKRNFNDIELVAGNVATEEGAYELLKRGVDAIKVGIGPGSICTTRVVAGVGVPQLTAIMECAKVIKGEVPLIADGGIRYSGDIVKALAAGADTVMIGSLFAGTDESPGEDIILEGRRFKSYRGMGSLSVLQKGEADRYMREGEVKMIPEGVEGMIPYKGPVKDIIKQLVGGVRVGMGYVGAKNIEELKKRAKFIRISWAGYKESHPHDVIITKESPNYPGWKK